MIWAYQIQDLTLQTSRTIDDIYKYIIMHTLSMGFALPGAIAAQLARPNQKVVAMCGDGGFLMNVQEKNQVF